MTLHRTLLIIALLLLAAPVGAQEEDAARKFRHMIPVEKNLKPEWVRSLRERGEREAWSGKDAETIGMPVGGIATGGLYLRADGTLGLWRIFNKLVFTGYGNASYRPYRPAAPVDSGFAVAVESGGKTEIRRLCRDDFPDVRFSGEYPIGLVRYAGEGFPLKIEMEAFSPFIPLNAPDSALPATLFHITLENASDKTVQASVLGWLQNAVLHNSAPGIHADRRTLITDQKGREIVIHRAGRASAPEAVKPRDPILYADFEGDDYGGWTTTGAAFGNGPARGTLPNQNKVSGFEGRGLVNSFLGGDGPQGTLTSPPFKIERRFINFLVGGGEHRGATCINLLVDGKPVRSTAGENSEELKWKFWNVEQFEGREATIVILDRQSGGWGHVNVDHIEFADKPRMETSGPVDGLEDFGSMALALSERGTPAGKLIQAAGDADWTKELHAEKEISFPVQERHSGAIATRQVELRPGAKRTFTFALSWFFPNHKNGHEYANRFRSAEEVAHYLLDNHDRLADETREWHKTFYEESNLPRWLLFRLHSTVANMATGTCLWWKDGRFWAWEGVGCCPGTCTHVWNYAHAHARLFPELARSTRVMQDLGEGFDKNSGLVGFRSNRALAMDGQCGTVLKMYREHTVSADKSWLAQNWPKIRMVAWFCMHCDENDDGLITRNQHNTYDIDFHGPNTFVGGLYLAALRAAEEMARDMGDRDFAARCRKVFQSGKKLTMEKLWNGEYFIQVVDLRQHPKFQYAEGCLSDQMFGQNWAHQLSLGYIYPQKNVEEALWSVWRYNWAPDVGPQNELHKPERWFIRPGMPGLFTCTWPKSPYYEEAVRYKNEVWTGIEYQVAAGMVWEGMIDEALVLCRAVHDRYHPKLMNPFNEVECGDHYARALASWGVFTALAGFEFHGPKGHIGFSPRMMEDDYKAAFTAAEGWGLFSQTRRGGAQTNRLDLRYGKLRLKSLAFGVAEGVDSPKVSLKAAGRKVNFSQTLENGRVVIFPAEELTIRKGEAVEVSIR